MNQVQLGSSDLHVTPICLGTMTFGEQVDEATAHAILGRSLERGVNFLDTAEMYSVPARAETCGATETILGNWFAKNPGVRSKLVLATKVAGPSRGFGWIRGGPVALDRANIMTAVEASLKRLQTDYIDLYQLHWPDRNVPMFGRIDYDPSQEKPTVPIEEQLAVLTELVSSGKVRHIGISNETAWGVAEFLKVAERLGLQRIVSIQNPYNLINRAFELGLHEMCHREQVGLLAYSPLAFGLLSGKYLATPQAAGRMTLFPAFGRRYEKPNVPLAVAEYAALANTHGLAPAALALAFVRSRPFVTSTILGATTMQQLRENLQEVELDAEILQGIAAIHLRYFNPAP